MNRHSGKRNPPDNETPAESRTHAQRRIGRIVHDDRGSASVEWRDAPIDHERQKLELEDTRKTRRLDPKLRGGLSLEVRNPDTFNPYDRNPDTLGGRPGTASGPKGGKRDLKKLSEWLKLMRAMEERKKNGDADE